MKGRCYNCNKIKDSSHFDLLKTVCKSCESKTNEVITSEKIEVKKEKKVEISKVKLNKKHKLKCTQCNRGQNLNCYSTDSTVCKNCVYATKQKLLPKKKHKHVTDISNIKVKGYAGIYIIKNTLTNKVYIGESSHLQKRKNNYVNNDGYINKYLKDDIIFYGLNIFTFTVLEYLPDSTKDQRLDREAFYKAKYLPNQLYNILPGRESREDYQLWKEQQNVLTPNSIFES